MGQRVQRRKTEVSDSEMKAAIANSWRSLFGETPTEEQVALIMAHIDLETGHRKAMWNYNIGNITTDGSSDYYDDLTTEEQISPGQWKSMNLKYRAYPSLQDGVLSYLRTLSKNPRYANAWKHIIEPDPEAYSKALKSGGYYTASEKGYTKTLKTLYEGRLGLTKEQLTLENPRLSRKIDKELKERGVQLDNKEFEELISSLEEDEDLENFLEQEQDFNIGKGKDFEVDFEKLLKEIMASKKDYFKYLPNNIITIKLSSDNFENSIECARILSSALDEELESKSFTHTDGNNVEVECSIPGPQNICVRAVKEITEEVLSSFYTATKKIGSITVSADLKVNSKSFYPEISFKTAAINHRKFLLKFI
jgi:hypothetical protein